MEDLLRGKGLYRISLGIKIALDDEENIAKWITNMIMMVA
jgi:hypothetical protein